MKATIISTDQIVEINAPTANPLVTAPHVKPLHPVSCVIARVWEGETDGGVKFTAYIPVVQVLRTDDNAEFERDLRETGKKPEDWTQRAIDMRFIV